MFLADTAKGTGGSVDGRGDVPTASHWVAIPRDKIVINLVLTALEDTIAAHTDVFEAMLKTLEITGAQTEEQKASK
jgi:hypothetical protein